MSEGDEGRKGETPGEGDKYVFIRKKYSCVLKWRIFFFQIAFWFCKYTDINKFATNNLLILKTEKHK